MHGSMSAAGGNQASRLSRAAQAPPADPTATSPWARVVDRAYRGKPPSCPQIAVCIQPERRLADTAASCSTLGRGLWGCDTLAEPACHGYFHFEAN
jgi:hypothetical protein